MLLDCDMCKRNPALPVAFDRLSRQFSYIEVSFAILGKLKKHWHGLVELVTKILKFKILSHRKFLDEVIKN